MIQWTCNGATSCVTSAYDINANGTCVKAIYANGVPVYWKAPSHLYRDNSDRFPRVERVSFTGDFHIEGPSVGGCIKTDATTCKYVTNFAACIEVFPGSQLSVGNTCLCVWPETQNCKMSISAQPYLCFYCYYDPEDDCYSCNCVNISSVCIQAYNTVGSEEYSCGNIWLWSGGHLDFPEYVCCEFNSISSQFCLRRFAEPDTVITVSNACMSVLADFGNYLCLTCPINDGNCSLTIDGSGYACLTIPNVVFKVDNGYCFLGWNFNVYKCGYKVASYKCLSDESPIQLKCANVSYCV